MVLHSGVFCIRSVKQNQRVEVQSPPKPGFDFAEALSRIYPLLDMIFRYLPLNDLKSCMEVCPSWKEKAEDLLLKRKNPSWFTCYKAGPKGRKSNNISHSGNLNFNNVEIGIILYDSCKIKLTKYVCLHSNISELSRKPVPQYLKEELVPESVDYCVLSVHRIASYFETERMISDVESHGSIMDGVFIPKIPSIRTVMFHCDPGKQSEMEKSIRMHIQSNEQVKCLLVFCKTHLYDKLYDLFECLIPRSQPESVALGGGVIIGTKTFHKISQDKRVYTIKDTVCIAFLKDVNSTVDNFNAYSCVIKGDHLSKQEFDSELLKFKQNIKIKRHSLGFRICCTAKYEVTELISFEEIFRGVPILGLDANGEIGWNCYPNADEEHKVKKPRKYKYYPQAQNAYSTVFVLITWE